VAGEKKKEERILMAFRALALVVPQGCKFFQCLRITHNSAVSAKKDGENIHF